MKQRLDALFFTDIDVMYRYDRRMERNVLSETLYVSHASLSERGHNVCNWRVFLCWKDRYHLDANRTTLADFSYYLQSFCLDYRDPFHPPYKPAYCSNLKHLVFAMYRISSRSFS